MMPDGLIHMAEVGWHGEWVDGVCKHGYYVRCRCGWTSDTVATRREARTVGDAHLAEANAPARPESR